MASVRDHDRGHRGRDAGVRRRLLPRRRGLALELADASAAATSGDVLLGMCILAAGADGNATRMLLFGTIRADAKFPALTIGASVYVGVAPEKFK